MLDASLPRRLKERQMAFLRDGHLGVILPVHQKANRWALGNHLTEEAQMEVHLGDLACVLEPENSK